MEVSKILKVYVKIKLKDIGTYLHLGIEISRNITSVYRE